MWGHMNVDTGSSSEIPRYQTHTSRWKHSSFLVMFYPSKKKKKPKQNMVGTP